MNFDKVQSHGKLSGTQVVVTTARHLGSEPASATAVNFGGVKIRPRQENEGLAKLSKYRKPVIEISKTRNAANKSGMTIESLQTRQPTKTASQFKAFQTIPSQNFFTNENLRVLSGSRDAAPARRGGKARNQRSEDQRVLLIVPGSPQEPRNFRQIRPRMMASLKLSRKQRATRPIQLAIEGTRCRTVSPPVHILHLQENAKRSSAGSQAHILSDSSEVTKRVDQDRSQLQQSTQIQLDKIQDPGTATLQRERDKLNHSSLISEQPGRDTQPSQRSLRKDSTGVFKGSNHDLKVQQEKDKNVAPPQMAVDTRNPRTMQVGGSVVTESLRLEVAEGNQSPDAAKHAGMMEDTRLGMKLPQRQTVRSLDFDNIAKEDAQPADDEMIQMNDDEALTRVFDHKGIAGDPPKESAFQMASEADGHPLLSSKVMSNASQVASIQEGAVGDIKAKVESQTRQTGVRGKGRGAAPDNRSSQYYLVPERQHYEYPFFTLSDLDKPEVVSQLSSRRNSGRVIALGGQDGRNSNIKSNLRKPENAHNLDSAKFSLTSGGQKTQSGKAFQWLSDALQVSGSAAAQPQQSRPGSGLVTAPDGQAPFPPTIEQLILMQGSDDGKVHTLRQKSSFFGSNSPQDQVTAYNPMTPPKGHMPEYENPFDTLGTDQKPSSIDGAADGTEDILSPADPLRSTINELADRNTVGDSVVYTDQQQQQQPSKQALTLPMDQLQHYDAPEDEALAQIYGEYLKAFQAQEALRQSCMLDIKHEAQRRKLISVNHIYNSISAKHGKRQRRSKLLQAFKEGSQRRRPQTMTNVTRIDGVYVPRESADLSLKGDSLILPMKPPRQESVQESNAESKVEDSKQGAESAAYNLRREPPTISGQRVVARPRTKNSHVHTFTITKENFTSKGIQMTSKATDRREFGAVTEDHEPEQTHAAISSGQQIKGHFGTIQIKSDVRTSFEDAEKSKIMIRSSEHSIEKAATASLPTQDDIEKGSPKSAHLHPGRQVGSQAKSDFNQITTLKKATKSKSRVTPGDDSVADNSPNNRMIVAPRITNYSPTGPAKRIGTLKRKETTQKKQDRPPSFKKSYSNHKSDEKLFNVAHLVQKGKESKEVQVIESNVKILKDSKAVRDVVKGHSGEKRLRNSALARREPLNPDFIQKSPRPHSFAILETMRRQQPDEESPLMSARLDDHAEENVPVSIGVGNTHTLTSDFRNSNEMLAKTVKANSKTPTILDVKSSIERLQAMARTISNQSKQELKEETEQRERIMRQDLKVVNDYYNEFPQLTFANYNSAKPHEFDTQMMEDLKEDLYGDYEMRKCKGRLHTLILTEQSVPVHQALIVNGQSQQDGIGATTPMRSRAFGIRGGIIAKSSSQYRSGMRGVTALSASLKPILVKPMSQQFAKTRPVSTLDKSADDVVTSVQKLVGAKKVISNSDLGEPRRLVNVVSNVNSFGPWQDHTSKTGPGTKVEQSRQQLHGSASGVAREKPTLDTIIRGEHDHDQTPPTQTLASQPIMAPAIAVRDGSTRQAVRRREAGSQMTMPRDTSSMGHTFDDRAGQQMPDDSNMYFEQIITEAMKQRPGKRVVSVERSLDSRNLGKEGSEPVLAQLRQVNDVGREIDLQKKKTESALATVPAERTRDQWVESKNFIAVFKDGDVMSRSDALSEMVPRPGFKIRVKPPKLEFERWKVNSRQKAAQATHGSMSYTMISRPATQQQRFRRKKLDAQPEDRNIDIERVVAKKSRQAGMSETFLDSSFTGAMQSALNADLAPQDLVSEVRTSTLNANPRSEHQMTTKHGFDRRVVNSFYTRGIEALERKEKVDVKVRKHRRTQSDAATAMAVRPATGIGLVRKNPSIDSKPVQESKKLDRQRTIGRPTRVTNLNNIPVQARLDRLRQMGRQLFPENL